MVIGDIKSAQQMLQRIITFGHNKRHSKKNQYCLLDIGEC